jgi:hypothetical protein
LSHSDNTFGHKIQSVKVGERKFIKMKNKSLSFLPLIWVIISILCTSFVVYEKSSTNTQHPPSKGIHYDQYKSTKTAFWERILVKKLKNALQKAVDLDEMAKSSQKLGLYALRCAFLVPLTVFFAGFYIFILLAVPFILAILALIKARKVNKHPDNTETQRTLARDGQKKGICALILGGIVTALIITFLVIAL